MIETLQQLDTQLLLAVNSVHNSFWDIFMRAYSGKWIWVPMYAAILWAVWRSYSWRVALVMTVAVALVITAADQTCATLIRPVVERVRPAQPDNPISPLIHIVGTYRGGHYGFPSCHAANSFGLAVFMSLLMLKRRWVIFIMSWCLINCYTRMYLGVHYPGDLLVGAIIGSTAAALIFLAAAFVVKKWAAPHGLMQTPRLRCLSIAGKELYYRDFDLPIAVGIITVLYILAKAAFNFF